MVAILVAICSGFLWSHAVYLPEVFFGSVRMSLKKVWRLLFLWQHRCWCWLRWMAHGDIMELLSSLCSGHKLHPNGLTGTVKRLPGKHLETENPTWEKSSELFIVIFKDLETAWNSQLYCSAKKVMPPAREALYTGISCLASIPCHSDFVEISWNRRCRRRLRLRLSSLDWRHSQSLRAPCCRLEFLKGGLTKWKSHYLIKNHGSWIHHLPLSTIKKSVTIINHH